MGKPKYQLQAKNETGDKTIDIQSFTVPDSSITAGSGIVNIATSTGDVTGPSSATDNAAVVFDSTTGKVIKDGASVNVLGKQFVQSFTTTATAAGTTTLTVASNPLQAFTGVTTQTVVLPVVTTLPKVGFQFTIINNSTGSLTVNSSGANLVQTVTAGAAIVLTCVLLTGTTAASWGVTYIVAADTAGAISLPANLYYTAGGVGVLGYRSADNTIALRGAGAETEVSYNATGTLTTTGGSISAQFDGNAVAGNTRMLVWDVDNGTLERVSVGAADSGGAGFKVLRIPN